MKFESIIDTLVNRNYHKLNSDTYVFYNNKNHKLEKDGYKFHLATKPHDTREIFEHIIPVLNQFNLSFKVVDANHINVGEVTLITIYSKDKPTTLEVGEILLNLLDEYEGEVIQGDLPFKYSKILYYTYGAITLDNEDQSKNQTSWKSKYSITVLTKQLMLNKKYQIENIIQKKPWGNTLLVKDIKTNQFYIAKQAKKGVLTNNQIDSFLVQSHEIHLARELNSHMIPKFIDSFASKDDYYSIWEYKQGNNLNYSYKGYSLFYNCRTMDLTKPLEDFGNIFSSLLDFVSTNPNYEINDYSLYNFVFDQNSKTLSLVCLYQIFNKDTQDEFKTNIVM
ncbi:hypothetical protein ACJA23_02850 [Mycoplasma corogypsi]|uniref:class III lanthionine synthetase LanKC N-terminal domain-containing protein n=1 Tax=Mycoplasma corogypsi TaxID=2106 RepID=UPI0038735DA5